MRLSMTVVLALCLAVSGFAQGTLDEQMEKVVIDKIDDLVKSLADCPTASPPCDKDQLAKLTKELTAALDIARERAAPLMYRMTVEKDPAIFQDLSKRHVALLTATDSAGKALGAKPTPDPLKLETDLAARIAVLVPLIEELTAKCNANDAACNLAKLSEYRFELRDVMQRATDIDKKILEEIKTAKLADTPALQARHVALLTALEPARKITFLVHEDRTAADELVDRIKATDDDLTHKEIAHREAKKKLKEAKEKGDRTAINQAEAAEEEADAARAEASTKLAELESKARDQGVADRAKIASIDEQLKSGNTEIDHAKLIAQRKTLTTRLGEIQSLVTIPSDGNPLYRIYDDDYEDWWVNQFYLGGEFDSVSGILNRGFARVGYTSWWHAGGENVPEAHPRTGFGNYGRHYIFNALLTSSAEQNVSKLFTSDGTGTDPCAPKNTAPADAKCVRRALETEQNFWFPLYRTRRHNRLRWYAGPLLSVGATFVDPDPNDTKTLHAAYRYYGGIRTSFARDAYGEFLFGRTSSLRSHRLEVRGEVPVAKWGAKSRLLLGWTANIRAGGKEAFFRIVDANRNTKIIPERDVYRVYVVYELDFLTLTGLQAPKQ